MKKIYYSYLLNGESDLRDALDSVFHSTEKQAKKARYLDCFSGEYKPGKLVKITLETVDD